MSMLSLYHSLISRLKTMLVREVIKSMFFRSLLCEYKCIWPSGATDITSFRKVLQCRFPNSFTSRTLFKELTWDARRHLPDCMKILIWVYKWQETETAQIVHWTEVHSLCWGITQVLNYAIKTINMENVLCYGRFQKI